LKCVERLLLTIRVFAKCCIKKGVK